MRGGSDKTKLDICTNVVVHTSLIDCKVKDQVQEMDKRKKKSSDREKAARNDQGNQRSSESKEIEMVFQRKPIK